MGDDKVTLCLGNVEYTVKQKKVNLLAQTTIIVKLTYNVVQD